MLNHEITLRGRAKAARESAPPVQSAAVPAEYGADLSADVQACSEKIPVFRPRTAALNRSSGQGCCNRHQFFSGNFGGVFHSYQTRIVFEVCRVGLPVNNVECDSNARLARCVADVQWLRATGFDDRRQRGRVTVDTENRRVGVTQTELQQRLATDQRE